MRKFLLLICFCLLTISTWGQIIISQNNFFRAENLTEQYSVAAASTIAIPQSGPDMVWDYSDLTIDDSNTINFFAVENKVDFPTALQYFSDSVQFLGVSAPTKTYLGLDANGFFVVGNETERTIIEFSQISGNPDDFVEVLDTQIIYEQRFDLLQFPLTYRDSWTQSQTQRTYAEVTIRDFFLIEIPGFQQTIYSQRQEVVGHGTLILPPINGKPSTSIEALLIKKEETQQDSFFLDGNTVADLILNLLNLRQGITNKKTSYQFYTNNFGSTVMQIDTDSMGNAIQAMYQFPEKTTSNTSPFYPPSTIRIQPNPVNTITTFAIENSYSGRVNFKLFNTHGQLIRSQQFHKTEEKYQYQLDCYAIPAGAYQATFKFGENIVRTSLLKL